MWYWPTFVKSFSRAMRPDTCRVLAWVSKLVECTEMVRVVWTRWEEDEPVEDSVVTRLRAEARSVSDGRIRL